MNKKRRIIWGIITLIIAVLTIRTIAAQNNSISVLSLLKVLRSSSPFYLATATLCMLCFIVFEGLSIQYLLCKLGYPVRFLQGIFYSAGDQFFSAITPSATGGQPASALFMKLHSIPDSAITICLIVNLIMYTLATLCIGMFCILIHPGILNYFDSFSKGLIFFGMISFTILTITFISLLKKQSILRQLGNLAILFLSRIHIIHNLDHWKLRLNNLIEDYTNCSEEMKGKPHVFLMAFFFCLMQRIAQISVTLTLHYAIRGNHLHTGTGPNLWMIQALSQIGSNCVPIPGGTGAADYLMLDGFQSLFDVDYAYILETISRFTSFYTCTIISGLISTTGFILHKYREKRNSQ